METKTAIDDCDDSGRLSALVACSIGAIFGLAPDGALHLWNDAAEQMFGYTGSELAGMSIDMLAAPDRRAEQADVIARIMAGEHVAPFGTVLRHKDGTPIHVCIAMSPVPDASGTLTGLIAIVRDMTDYQRLLHQVLQRQKLEAVSRLAGGLAHDFNNLLMAINGSAELALTELAADSPAIEDLDAIVAAANEAGELTSCLLAFSRRRAVRPQQLDVALMLRRTERLLRNFLPENVELYIRIDTASSVFAAPGDLEQVLLNLVMNACDAMPDGGRITISADDLRAPKPIVRIRVDDDGGGMSDEVRARVLEPFYTTKPMAESNGLGLWSVYGAVQRADGRVKIASEVGEGTCVTIELPTHGAPRRASGLHAAPAAAGARTILLVEDERGVRRVSARILARLGYEVIEAADGAEALRAAARHHTSIDLVITDVVMPVMGGRELAAEIQRRHPECKILVVSGYAGTEPIASEMPFLQKPFTAEVLGVAVRRVLDETH